MSATLVGVIVAASVVICGIGCYFIGREMGIEWVLEHTNIEVIENEKGGAADEQTEN